MRKKIQSEAALKIAACSALALCAVFYDGQARAAIIRTADADTVVLWHLDDTTPNQLPGGVNDFVDSSGNGYHGVGADIPAVATDQIVMGQPGVLGLSAQLNGPTANKRSFINRSGNIATEWTSNSFTFEAWIKNPGSLATADSAAAGGVGRLIGFSRPSAVNWSLGIGSNGALRVFSNLAVGALTSFTQVSSALTWDNNAWYYVALVSDDAATANPDTAQWTVYRAKDGATSLTTVMSFEAKRTAAGNSVVAGGDNNSTDDTAKRAFHGFIDEVHFSNGARSVAYLTGALVSVPEPSSLFLISCAVIGFSAVRRRRVRG
jgi:hypothetical protein